MRLLCPDRRDQTANADDRHQALHVVGQHVQRHFGGNVFECFILKCVAPIHALIVPKGCSTVSRRNRILSGLRSGLRGGDLRPKTLKIEKFHVVRI